jgi:hypothetical protein
MAPMFMIVCCAQQKQLKIGVIFSSIAISAKEFGIICKYPGDRVQLLRVLCLLLEGSLPSLSFLR